MISELSLIRSYSTFWKSLFPGGEDYIRLINSGLGKKENSGITIVDKPHRRALLNNVSFSLFEKVINKDLSEREFKALKNKSDLLLDISKEEIKKLSNLRFGGALSTDISKVDFELICWITNALLKTYKNKHKLVLRPVFKGCGILFEAEADLLYSNTLSEIKAGDRTFGVQDLRQIYVYIALNSLENKYAINKVELYNPRTGLLWNEYVEVVSDNIAGTPTIEIVNEILDFVTNDSLYT